ncbi:DNA polymerase beta domain protein region [mine drainage metagenome]|uniref:DNA polymerase beta domain protein region n=1 Tax=mine drainage metagenome TaxID=410659 RepID=T1B990_9ZZZZ
METKIYISDGTGAEWKELAMKRFGYGRGSISKAAEEALSLWIASENRIIKTISALKDIAKHDKGIEAVLLFGSYARKESYNDIDVALLLEKNADKIGILAKCSSVLPSHPKFDLSIFNDMPIETQSRVLNEGTVIYVKDTQQLLGLSAGIIERLSDQKRLLDNALV